MIYCTLIYGKDWHEKFARNIAESERKLIRRKDRIL